MNRILKNLRSFLSSCATATKRKPCIVHNFRKFGCISMRMFVGISNAHVTKWHVYVMFFAVVAYFSVFESPFVRRVRRKQFVQRDKMCFTYVHKMCTVYRRVESSLEMHLVRCWKLRLSKFICIFYNCKNVFHMVFWASKSVAVIMKIKMRR